MSSTVETWYPAGTIAVGYGSSKGRGNPKR